MQSLHLSFLSMCDYDTHEHTTTQIPPPPPPPTQQHHHLTEDTLSDLKTTSRRTTLKNRCCTAGRWRWRSSFTSFIQSFSWFCGAAPKAPKLSLLGWLFWPLPPLQCRWCIRKQTKSLRTTCSRPVRGRWPSVASLPLTTANPSLITAGGLQSSRPGAASR